MADKAPRNNAHCTHPGRSGAEHLPVHHRRRQARAPVAGRRAAGAAHLLQEAHRHRHGRSSPRSGEVRTHRPAGARHRNRRPRPCSKAPMKVLLGVGGGIAAYKAAELARLLMQRGSSRAGGHDPRRGGVRPAPHLRRAHRPQGAHRPVSRSRRRQRIEHIAVAQENELLVIAPATADLLAKFAHGLADDFLTTLYLAFTGPVVLAPAMNTNMWKHPATQANLATLREARPYDRRTGQRISGLRHGRPGRLAEPEAIAEAVVGAQGHQAGSGRRDRPDHRRSHAGAARSGALYLQSLQRQDGICAGRGSRRARRPRHPGLAARCNCRRRAASKWSPCAPPSRCARR